MPACESPFSAAKNGFRRCRESALRAFASIVLLPGAAAAGDVDILLLDGFESGCGNLIYSQAFALPDSSAWPAEWSVLGNVAAADIQQSAARLRPGPTSYSLARMGADIVTRNVEVRFTLRLEDAGTQGVGFYVRQNGGYLQDTVPRGQGYAAFAEGSFRGTPGIGVWREVDGEEQQIGHQFPYPMVAAGIDYRVRFQVMQSAPTQTLVQAKLWPDGDPEPFGWQASATDTTTALQNLDGGIAIDSWSSIGTPDPISAYTFVDNLELISLCVP
jgi:hypothetical protein